MDGILQVDLKYSRVAFEYGNVDNTGRLNLYAMKDQDRQSNRCRTIMRVWKLSVQPPFVNIGKISSRIDSESSIPWGAGLRFTRTEEEIREDRTPVEPPR
ncbi:hypothetical protein BDZ97DRAFT_588810 [Flammula alnicola]|nr:hypothetical protein BDZ97DRAFT_588810 [Flammula alnicola]